MVLNLPGRGVVPAVSSTPSRSSKNERRPLKGDDKKGRRIADRRLPGVLSKREGVTFAV